MLYGVSFLEVKGHSAETVLNFLVHALNQDSMEIQAVAAMGISKLMLSGMITDAEVLKRLVLVYFAPETLDNLELRQCLSYFLPVYCYSNSANQKKMQEVSIDICSSSSARPILTFAHVQIFLPCLNLLSEIYEELDDPSVMVSPLQLSNQLLDWTDPQKAVYVYLTSVWAKAR
jgi:condensin complex subunit 3